jgi:hypothetical protein
VVDGNRVIFESGAGTAKTRNLAADARVAICWDEYLDDWDALAQVVAFGRARELHEEERAKGKALLERKFPQFLTKTTIDDADVLYEVVAERVSSWGV